MTAEAPMSPLDPLPLPPPLPGTIPPVAGGSSPGRKSEARGNSEPAGKSPPVGDAAALSAMSEAGLDLSGPPKSGRSGASASQPEAKARSSEQAPSGRSKKPEIVRMPAPPRRAAASGELREPPANEPPKNEPPRPGRRGSVIAAPRIRTSEPTLGFWQKALRLAPSWLLSAAVHAGLLIVLALLAPLLIRPSASVMISGELKVFEPVESLAPVSEVSPDTPIEPIPDAAPRMTSIDVPTPQLASAEPVPEALALSVETAARLNVGAASKMQIEGAFRGRDPQARGVLGREQGATPASESAVEMGLRWLANHQRSDGSWRFNHSPMCEGQCRNPGTAPQTTAATGVALLAFLGAGHTQHRGDYKNVVKNGLNYLKRRSLTSPHGADYREGTMYAHGIAAIALCEAYGLTRDPDLKDYATQAVRFIVYAQDPDGGGWRYIPGQPGDTTVTGWQLMALKSGQMAYIPCPPATLANVGRFLDSVQADYGAQYGYQGPGQGEATTAIGLLCRMYLGWRPETPALRRGVAWLGEQGPSRDNMYFNYYATQVLFHAGGPEWERWNATMRDKLVAEQALQGHERGSWYYPGGNLETGGRLLSTALAVMTLEVYYRHMPLYRSTALDEY